MLIRYLNIERIVLTSRLFIYTKLADTPARFSSLLRLGSLRSFRLIQFLGLDFC